MSAAATACPIDGSVRVIVAETTVETLLRCPWCRQVEIIAADPTRAGLQRATEWAP